MGKKNGKTNVVYLVKALKHILSLDGTEAEVDIINMSLGGLHESHQGLHDVILELEKKKKIMIAAAGMHGQLMIFLQNVTTMASDL